MPHYAVRTWCSCARARVGGRGVGSFRTTPRIVRGIPPLIATDHRDAKRTSAYLALR